MDGKNGFVFPETGTKQHNMQQQQQTHKCCRYVFPKKKPKIYTCFSAVACVFIVCVCVKKNEPIMLDRKKHNNIESQKHNNGFQ